MRLVYILIISLLLSLTVWVLWIVSKPGRYRLMDCDQQEQLDAMLAQAQTHGNALRTYTDGLTLRDDMLADLCTACNSIHLQFFKFEDDTTGRALASLMADKVTHGVECRLLYDDFACHPWRSFYRQMRRNGVQAVGFNPVHWPLPIKRDYYRNHRKTVVIDGRIAYVGGFNLADRYVHGLPWGRWRDTMLRIEGPAVAQVQRIFMADWRFATGNLPPLSSLFPPLPPAGNQPVQIIASGPIGYGPALLDYTCRLLDQAQHYVWFESPYYLPPTPLRQALLRAAERGVDVRILQPPRGDRGETTQLASKSFYAEALRSGIRIGIYEPGYLHSKIIVCDDKVGVVGTCNIDTRSHLLCEEAAAVVESTDYALELKAVFLADEADSHYIDIHDWERRPALQRLGEYAVRTIATLL